MFFSTKHFDEILSSSLRAGVSKAQGVVSENYSVHIYIYAYIYMPIYMYIYMCIYIIYNMLIHCMCICKNVSLHVDLCDLSAIL